MVSFGGHSIKVSLRTFSWDFVQRLVLSVFQRQCEVLVSLIVQSHFKQSNGHNIPYKQHLATKAAPP